MSISRYGDEFTLMHSTMQKQTDRSSPMETADAYKSAPSSDGAQEVKSGVFRLSILAERPGKFPAIRSWVVYPGAIIITQPS